MAVGRGPQRALQSADTVSFVLSSPDGAPLPKFSPGQYVSVAVRLPDGARQIRQYSLTSAPSHDDWRISVKRVPRSTASDGADIDAGEVSNFLYDNVFEGDVLEVTTPSETSCSPRDKSRCSWCPPDRMHTDHRHAQSPRGDIESP